TAYAFGLSITQTCDFRVSVSHGGGLPGFGSTMRWLPEYGVGLVAFGNLTYTGWGRASADIFDRLQTPGGPKPREPPPSRALAAAPDAVSRLVAAWDDALADRMAAENLFLDRSKERRRAELDELHAKVGACTMPAERIDSVENALRGQ